MGWFDRAVSALRSRFGGRPVGEEFTISEAPGGAKRDPSLVVIKRVGLANGVSSGSRQYQEPEYDLNLVTRAYNTEAYVRIALDKYIELMFKSGHEFVSKNPNATDYIKNRFAMMAEATQNPTDNFLLEVAEDLVKYSNVLIVKARADSSGGQQMPKGVSVQGLAGQAPIAGYFVLNATQVKVLRDKNGTVKGWQQEVEGGDKPAKYKSEDIIHLYYKREKGNAFGAPFVIPAIADVQALRQAEENVLRLIYRHIYPYIHTKVGTEELPASDDEIINAQQNIQSMDSEGGLVTSERVSMAAVAADKVIDAERYLRYFEDRVFTGLGVSATLMGRGGTANRATADTISTEMRDRIKAFQRVMATFINAFVVRELLLEGGFDPILNPDDQVEFRFREIDADARIKQEAAAVYLYEHNAITEDEMRNLIGRDPLSDRALMFMNLVTIPISDATAGAKAAAIGGGGPKSPKSGGSPETNNKVKPTNQHGQKLSPKKTAAGVDDETDALRESYALMIQETYEDFRIQVIDSVRAAYAPGANRQEVADRIAQMATATEGRIRQLTHTFIAEGAVDISLLYWRRMVHQIGAAVVETINRQDLLENSIDVANSFLDVAEDRVDLLVDQALSYVA